MIGAVLYFHFAAVVPPVGEHRSLREVGKEPGRFFWSRTGAGCRAEPHWFCSTLCTGLYQWKTGTGNYSLKKSFFLFIIVVCVIPASRANALVCCHGSAMPAACIFATAAEMASSVLLRYFLAAYGPCSFRERSFVRSVKFNSPRSHF